MGDQDNYVPIEPIIRAVLVRIPDVVFRLPKDPRRVRTAHVDRLMADADADRLAGLIRDGDPGARQMAGRLIDFAIKERHAGLLSALMSMPEGNGEKVEGALAIYLSVAAGASDPGPIRDLLTAGFPPDRPYNGSYAIHHARTANVVRALLDAGADPDQVDQMGWRPAVSLLERGWMDGLEALLDGGANVALFLRSLRRKRERSLEERLSAWLFDLPGAKPWFKALVIADPTAPWAMRLLARLGVAESAGSDVGDQDQGGQ